ncbi:MAG: acyl carrier protein [Gammaproteobacteria bacterium]|nr:acyl carrier protein [Gammaproteobacteria bacterium]
MRAKIRSVIENNLNVFDSDVEFSDDDNIFRKGFVDSLFAVQLLDYLEQEFRIKISSQDLNIDNFYSVNRIISFVEEKRRQDGGTSA